MVQPGSKGTKGGKGTLDLQDLRGLRDSKGTSARLEHRGTKGGKEPASKVLRGGKDFRGMLVLQASKVPREMLVLQARKERKDLRETKEMLGLKVIKVGKVM